ncbi:MAG: asparagine synthetase B [Nitrospiraceae bacterium]|nr:MAG: asparagine synthetase B [Nitrospiraceae bacterium]
MCGIAGLVTLPQGAPPFEADVLKVVRRVLGALEHRGPDDGGVEQVDDGVSLGATRLAILDLSRAGHQPMCDPDTGNWIVHNGEVYNFRELRPLLGGRWRSGTDTEVVLRAYAAWGPSCLDRLRGMFAFAVWDARRNHLFVARDRFGIKPLYYYVGDGFFLFASEVRALLASGLVPARLDATALWQYLAYQSVPPPSTLVRDVRMLPPGHYLTVSSEGEIRLTRWWDLWERTAALPAGAEWSDRGAVRRRVRELLAQSVECRLVSDVPVGVFLSGGVDSSAVTALVREAGQTPRTFSVVFAERAYDEALYSRAVARRFGTDHTEIQLSERDLLDQLPDALAAMDHPSGDGVNTYVVARAVRSAGYKVALSGLGGDEVFGGYPSFARLTSRWLRAWASAPAGVRRSVAAALRATGSSVRTRKVAALLERAHSIPSAFPVLREVLSAEQRRALLRPGWLPAGEPPDPYVETLAAALDGVPAGRRHGAVAYAEARTYMHDVLLRDTDQMSMAHGLEVRVPLLDHLLAEYVVALPDAAKRPRDGVAKALLVESLDGLLPKDVVRRPKRGFTLPFDPWIRGALRGFCERRLERLAERGVLRPEGLRDLWSRFLARDPAVSWSRVWILVSLEEWLEHNGIVTRP